MSNCINEPFAAYEAEQRRDRERLLAAKPLLLDALRRTRAATIAIAYDGVGDSGQIEDIVAHSAAGRRVKLKGSVSFDLCGQSKEYPSLDEALDEFAWAVLRAYHDGFENDDGGFGTLTIDVRTGKVTLDHNDRVSDIANTVSEV